MGDDDSRSGCGAGLYFSIRLAAIGPRHGVRWRPSSHQARAGTLLLNRWNAERAAEDSMETQQNAP